MEFRENGISRETDTLPSALGLPGASQSPIAQNKFHIIGALMLKITGDKFSFLSIGAHIDRFLNLTMWFTEQRIDPIDARHSRFS